MWFPLTREQIEGETTGSCAIGRRFFGLDGKDYPRLVVALYASEVEGSIEVYCSSTEGKNNRWESCSIPLEVAENLAAMLVMASKNKPDKELPSLDYEEKTVLCDFGSLIHERSVAIQKQQKCSLRYAVTISVREAERQRVEKQRAEQKLNLKKFHYPSFNVSTSHVDDDTWV